jgi:hypothetical protein
MLRLAKNLIRTCLDLKILSNPAGLLAMIAVILGLSLTTGALAYAGTPAEPQPAAAKLARIPLSFEANQGQTNSQVKFLCHGSGYSMFLTQDEVVLNLERQQSVSQASGPKSAVPLADTLHMKLMGAAASSAVSGTDPLPGVVSYFLGDDPQKWQAGIHTYGKVRYTQIYPGVDLVFYGNQRQLEYDFVVAPGADAGEIAWQIDGAHATVDAEGNLILSAANGPASFKKPILYQMDDDKRSRLMARSPWRAIRSVSGWAATTTLSRWSSIPC